jgi:hypothetical protein
MLSRNSLSCCIIIVWFVALACSCQADNRVVGWGSDVRWVSALPWYADPPQAALSVMTVSEVHAIDSDIANHADWLAKVELDFGEGLGWQDFTQQFLDAPTLSFRPSTLQLSLTHTYAQAGTYTIRIRATYWDGEVVTTSEMRSSAAITVTVPQSS